MTLPISARRLRSCLCAASVPALLSATPCAAQTQTPPSGQERADTPTTVTVTVQKPEVVHKPDRDSYDVSRDPDAATGSAADVMNNIPALSVDPDGSVTLRGDPNVQIYVNGKPDAQMQGDSLAEALQSLPADSIDRIEVMTSPSAAFGASSGGGIINIILKQGRHIQPRTTVKAALGDEGRYQAGLYTGRVFGKLSLNGGVNLRGEPRKNGSAGSRVSTDPVSGRVTRSSQINRSNTRAPSFSGWMNADYDLNDHDTLSLNGGLWRQTRSGYSATDYTYADANGNPTSQTAQTALTGGLGDSSNMRLSWDQRGDSPDDDFKMQVSHNQSRWTSRNAYRQIYHWPVRADSLYASRSDSHTRMDGFSGDWKRAVGGGQQLQAGWDIQHTISGNDNYRSANHTEGAPEVANPSYTNLFKVDQTLSAAYVTWQKTIGKFSAQAGLRTERLREKLDQATSGVTAVIDQTDWSPSLYALYTISDQNSLRASYGHKIVRPNANLLNPFLRYRDAQNVSSGNPHLLPEQVATLELAYNHTTRPLTWSATLFAKTTRDLFSRGSLPLPGSPDIVLTTSVNDGERRDAGLQYAIDGHGSQFRYGLSGVLGRSSQDMNDYVTGADVHRDSDNSSAKLYARWSPDKVQSLGVNLRWQGRQLQSQGYRDGSAALNLSYQYQIVPNKLQLNANARDVLSSQGARSVTETSTLYAVSDREDYGASFMLALRYTFGPTPPQRD